MFRYLLCSFALVLVYPLGIDLYLVGLPDIARDLNASQADLHLAFSIYLAGMASTMLLAGWLADRIGRKPIALMGAATFAIASWYAASSVTVDYFLFARFGQGIGAGFCYVVTFAILRDTLDDDKRAKILTMINGITCIVPVLAPVIGHLILMGFEWPSLFISMAIMATLIFQLCLLILKETKPSHIETTHRNMNTSTQSCHRVNQAHDHKANLANEATKKICDEPLGSRLFISRLIMTSLAVTAILTYVNTSPMLLMEQMGYSTGKYSAAMAGLAVISMTSSFLAPKLLTHFGQQRIMLASQGLYICSAVVFMAGYQFELDSRVNLLGISLICAGFSLGFGTAMSQALSPFSRRAGMASSVLGIFQIACSAAYITAMGWLGISTLNMLIFLLLTTGLTSIILLHVVPSDTASSDKLTHKVSELNSNDKVPASS
ncbi:MFS transporter [Shewanella violacea]|uniref:Transporter, putative n=1 Tax=Shewanella violacea (strain JCM 10179 / CIP 106290 / LMG 19151 / DSS12) TaxID=637905 RepID=D4ZK63_SHEVD|nr:MFS transporter [Shewanella violacea]BAJ02062.1 transporter, putative [Shewanella violacea DSS12]